MTASKKQIGGNHYAQFAIQPGEFIYKNKLGWCEANAIKYICRHSLKAGRQDVEKAIHYLQLLLEWEYGEKPPAYQEPRPSASWPYGAPGSLPDIQPEEIDSVPGPVRADAGERGVHSDRPDSVGRYCSGLTSCDD